MRKIRTIKEEESIYSEQTKEITRKYGKRAAETANYGWFADDYVIRTKVYIGGMVLTTGLEADRFIHYWESY